jgi:ABC-type Fe3+/spermidine/putrescine transport system ATPase subunit
MASHVELTGVTKRYADATAVDRLDLTIEEGSFTCLLGPSGCGKTTTLRMIAGFVEPDEGEITIRGVSQRGVSPNRRPTSIVFQDYALFPHMSVARNVGYGLRVKHLPKAEVAERVARTLELLDLTRYADRLPRQLSGGQQQRVALARSLVTEPEVILMDEPLSNLDAKMRVRLRADLQALQRRLGLTTIYVTHDQEEALSMGDSVAVLNEGVLQQVGPPKDLYRRPNNRFVADFIGLNNFLTGRCKDVDNARITVELEGGGSLVAMRRPEQRPVGAGQAVSVAIRPESFSLHTDGRGDGNVIEGRVESQQFLGALSRYVVTVGDTDVLFDDHQMADDVVDRTIRLHAPAEKIQVFTNGEDEDG